MAKRKKYDFYWSKKCYAAWYNMFERLKDPNKEGGWYRNLVLPEINVCERWRSKETGFINFHTDMGEPPEGKCMLARFDITKDYSPDNCVWTENKIVHNNPQVVEKNKNARRNMSEETRQKMSKSLSGKPKSEETKMRMKLAWEKRKQNKKVQPKLDSKEVAK